MHCWHAQRANMICQTDSGRTDESVASELQRQVAVVCLVYKFNTLPTLLALQLSGGT